MKDYSFGNYICALRTGLGLSQFQLGALVGVSDKAVSKWENADAKPRIGTCRRLAAVLGVSIDQLLSCEHEITISARKELEKMNSDLWKEAYRRLEIYGRQPPTLCLSRLAAEEATLRDTDAIQSIAFLGRLQEQARKHKTVAVAAGMVHSSFTAWLFGATPVNPLPAHYRCPCCGAVEFAPEGVDGFDLPPRQCACGGELLRDGHGIPYQGYAQSVRRRTNLEIRMSSEFMPNAVAMLRGFYEGVAQILPIRYDLGDGSRPMERYAIVTDDRQKPPISEDGFWHCSWEEYWQWREEETTYMFIPSRQIDTLESQVRRSGELLPEPTALMTSGMFQDLYQRRCGQYPNVAGLATGEGNCTFRRLIRMDGMAHGTFTQTQWEWFRTLPFDEIPATREDIYDTVSAALAARGVRDEGFALLVTENAQKGLYHSRGIPESHLAALTSLELPQWYPDYLRNTRYLFPKGHCIAHLLLDGLCRQYSKH